MVQKKVTEVTSEKIFKAIKAMKPLPENTPWLLRNERGETVAHLYAAYAFLPQSFNQWGARVGVGGETVAEIALANHTLPSTFSRYDLFPSLFPMRSFYDIKEALELLDKKRMASIPPVKKTTKAPARRKTVV